MSMWLVLQIIIITIVAYDTKVAHGGVADERSSTSRDSFIT
jgi:hypothetical protein